MTKILSLMFKICVASRWEMWYSRLCCRLYGGLLILICSAVLQDNILTAFMFFFFWWMCVKAAEEALHHCGCPWSQRRRCRSLSVVMGRPGQTGPTYSNAKHLLAFLNCLLVPNSRSRGRWCWPEVSCYNIWNKVIFHWSVWAAALKSRGSPPSAMEDWTVWAQLLQAVVEACSLKGLDLHQLCFFSASGPTNVWLWPNPEVEFTKWPFQMYKFSLVFIVGEENAASCKNNFSTFPNQELIQLEEWGTDGGADEQRSAHATSRGR